MGRKQKVSAVEVLDYLRDHNPAKVREIAREFKVCGPTIRSRLQQLRDGGKTALAHNREGIHLIEEVTDDNQDVIYQTGTWVIGEVVGMVKAGKSIKKPLIQVSRLKALTKEERREAKQLLYRMARMLDFMAVEEEDE